MPKYLLRAVAFAHSPPRGVVMMAGSAKRKRVITLVVLAGVAVALYAAILLRYSVMLGAG